MWFSESQLKKLQRKVVVHEEKDFSSHALCLYNLYFCFCYSCSVVSSFLFLQAAVPGKILATSLLGVSKPAALVLARVMWVLPALLRQSCLVSLKVTWLDLASFSRRLKSTRTMNSIKQWLQQQFLADGCCQAAPAWFRREHLSAGLVADSINSLGWRRLAG